jgi:hypothetical protein
VEPRVSVKGSAGLADAVTSCTRVRIQPGRGAA